MVQDGVGDGAQVRSEGGAAQVASDDDESGVLGSPDELVARGSHEDAVADVHVRELVPPGQQHVVHHVRDAPADVPLVVRVEERDVRVRERHLPAVHGP